VTELLLGFMAAAFLFSTAATVYSHWRYNYIPWKVLRADMRAQTEINTQVQGSMKDLQTYVQRELGLRKALALTDEEVARIEAKQQARRVLG